MSRVPTLHIRNVPSGVYEALRNRAQRSGRSLNAEVVQALQQSIGRDERHGFMERLDQLRQEWLLPDDAPKPEDVIRAARDERDREVERRVRGS